MTAQAIDRRPRKGQGGGMKSLGRAVGYLNHYRKTALIAVVALLISIGAQLMVPQMIQDILDAVVGGMAAQQVASLPVAEQTAALTRPAFLPSNISSLRLRLSGLSTSPSF